MHARSDSRATLALRWFKKLIVKARNARLGAWGQAVPATPLQRAAMRELWRAFQEKKPPAHDPLMDLSDQDRSYILHICSADFRPAEFGDCSVLRYAGYLYLTKLGFTKEQAAVCVGMLFNDVGPIAE